MEPLLNLLKSELSLQGISKDNKLWKIFLNLEDAYIRTLVKVFPVTLHGEILNDVNKLILLYIDDKDLISIMRTCKVLRDLPYDDLFWKTRFIGKYSVDINSYIKSANEYESSYKKFSSIKSDIDLVIEATKLGYVSLLPIRCTPEFIVSEKVLTGRDDDTVTNIKRMAMTKMHRICICIALEYHKLDALKFHLGSYPKDTIPLLHSFDEEPFNIMVSISSRCNAEEFTAIETFINIKEQELKSVYREAINFRNAELLDYILQNHESLRNYFPPLYMDHEFFHMVENDVLKEFEGINHEKGGSCHCAECLNDAIGDKIRDIMKNKEYKMMRVLIKNIPKRIFISSINTMGIDMILMLISDHFDTTDIPLMLHVLVRSHNEIALIRVMEQLHRIYKGDDFKKVLHSSILTDILLHQTNNVFEKLSDILPKNLGFTKDPDQLKLLRVDQLKLLLKYKKLKVSGKKDELILRLSNC